MYQTCEEFRKFYYSRSGWVIKRILQANLKRHMDNNLKCELAIGTGYSLPYMRVLTEAAQSQFAFIPSQFGEAIWPRFSKNKTASVATTQMPIASGSVDLILATHFLEFSEYPEYALQELYRILKGEGRVLLLVPNRMSIWSRRDWSPFGHGQPYSILQLRKLVTDAKFEIMDEHTALFMLPFHSRFFIKAAWTFERFGQLLFGGMGGVHVLELKKKVYAPTQDKGSAVPVGVKKKSAPVAGNARI